MNGVLIDSDRRVMLCKLPGDCPVRRHTSTVDQPRCSKEEGATAHRAVWACFGRCRAEPLADRNMGSNICRVGTSGYQQRVDLHFHGVDEGEIRHEPYPRRTADGTHRLCHDEKPISVFSRLHIGLGKYIERPRYIQKLHTGHRQDRDGSRNLHRAPTSAWDGFWPKMT